MTVSYTKLWTLLVNRKISIAQLRKMTGLNPNTITKLKKGEDVRLDTLCRICEVLDVDIGDIVEITRLGKGGRSNGE